MDARGIQIEDLIFDESFDAIVDGFDAESTPRRRQHESTSRRIHTASGSADVD